MASSSSVANAAFQASMNLHKISMGMASMQIDTAASEPTITTTTITTTTITTTTLPDSLVPLTQSFTRSCDIEERCHKFRPKDYPPRAPPADPLDELKALVHRMQSRVKKSNNPPAIPIHPAPHSAKYSVPVEPLEPGTYITAANIRVVRLPYIRRGIARLLPAGRIQLLFYNDNGNCKEVYVNVSDIEDLGLRKTRDPPEGRTFTVKELSCLYHVGRAVPKVHTVDRKAQLDERRRKIKAKENALPRAATNKLNAELLAMGVNADWSVKEWYFGKTFRGEDGNKYTNPEMAMAERVRLSLCSDTTADFTNEEISDD